MAYMYIGTPSNFFLVVYFFPRRLCDNPVTFSIIAERLTNRSLLQGGSNRNTTTIVYDRILNHAVFCPFETRVD